MAHSILIRVSGLLALSLKERPGQQASYHQPPTAMNKTEDVSITPFLMFTGKAEEAMGFYVSLFPGAGIGEIERWGPDEPGAEGSVKLAAFSLNGQRVMCTDSPPVHDFTFTPSFSFFVSVADEGKFDRYCSELSTEGKFLMPPDNYGFSTKFAWLEDRFGVSWQLNLP